MAEEWSTDSHKSKWEQLSEIKWNNLNLNEPYILNTLQPPS